MKILELIIDICKDISMIVFSAFGAFFVFIVLICVTGLLIAATIGIPLAVVKMIMGW